MNAQQIANRPADTYAGLQPCAVSNCAQWGNTASVLFRGGSGAVCEAHRLLESDAILLHDAELRHAASESLTAYQDAIAGLADAVAKAACERCGKAPYTPGFPGLCVDCSDWVFL